MDYDYSAIQKRASSTQCIRLVSSSHIHRYGYFLSHFPSLLLLLHDLSPPPPPSVHHPVTLLVLISDLF